MMAPSLWFQIFGSFQWLLKKKIIVRERTEETRRGGKAKPACPTSARHRVYFEKLRIEIDSRSVW
jgi:hypothetical protein